MADLHFGEGELPDDLQDKLDQYNKNFEALDTFLGDTSLTDSSMATGLRVERTKEILAQALPIGVQSLIQLAAYSKTDSVRLKASVYLIDRCLGRDGAIGEEDEAVKLIKRLAQKEVN